MKVLITGGSGFLGKAIVAELVKQGYQIIVQTRNLSKTNKTLGMQGNVEFCSILGQISTNEKIDYIINLAGEPIFQIPWTESKKGLIFSSRMNVTDELVKLISRLKVKPKQFINASAIGWYGPNQSGVTINENYRHHSKSFSHTLCEAWESKAIKIRNYAIDVKIARFGIVLGKDGGLLDQFTKPFKYGLGFYLGSGREYMSWIHIEDIVRGILFLMTHEFSNGTTLYNFTSPSPVTNKDFSLALSKIMKKPLWIRIPASIISMVFGQVGRELFLNDIKALPQNLLDSGFEFKFKDLDSALEDLMT